MFPPIFLLLFPCTDFWQHSSGSSHICLVPLGKTERKKQTLFSFLHFEGWEAGHPVSRFLGCSPLNCSLRNCGLQRGEDICQLKSGKTEIIKETTSSDCPMLIRLTETSVWTHRQGSLLLNKGPSQSSTSIWFCVVFLHNVLSVKCSPRFKWKSFAKYASF